MRFDAAIVGAGPAGCVAARELARAGARIAIVDGSHPREKACGGGVTARAMTLVSRAGHGDQRPARSGHPIEFAVFQGAARDVRVPLPQRDLLQVFPRADLDASLLEDAVASGAVHVARRVTSIDRDVDGWSVAIGGDALRAQWLLGADGASGLTRKRLFRRFARRQISIAAGSFVDGVNTPGVVIGFIDRPSGYLWSFPRHDHLAVGVCAQADRTSTAELHAIADRWLDGYAPAAGGKRRRYAWPIPSLSDKDLDEERSAGDRWMLLGDAAGLVDPITREGIFFALRSGSLAAAALAGSDPTREYGAAIRDEIHTELRRAARLREAFFRPRFTSLLIDALNQSAAIRAVMVDLIAGSQSYAGLKRRLLSTFELRLVIKLLGPD
jgi:geranylgeranyl reductase family protein